MSMFQKLKKLYKKSVIYRLYKCIKKHPVYRFFTEYSYFKKSFFSVSLINFLYKKFNRIVEYLNYNIKIPVISQTFLIVFLWMTALFPVCSIFISVVLILLFVADTKYIKDTFVYVFFSLIYFVAIFGTDILLKNNSFIIFYKLWLGVSIFIINSVYLKKSEEVMFLKNICALALFLLLLNICFNIEKNFELITLIPFVLLFVIKKLRGMKRCMVFILFSGLILLYLRKTEAFKMFSINFNSLSFDFTAKNVFLFINRGIMGMSKTYEGVLKDTIDKEKFGLKSSEEVVGLFFVLIIFIFLLIFGKYIFRFLRKILYSVVKKNSDRHYVMCAILFFICTSIYMVVKNNSANEFKNSYLYWCMLGFIKSNMQQKNKKTTN